ncbi:MAG TPA: archease, partial [Thermoanaerobaculia bacterium]|nr:archease [Thermoanaerobaculia bacterium]
PAPRRRSREASSEPNVFEFLPHTADIRMRVAAPDLPDLFRDALRGLMSVLGPRPERDRPVRRLIAVHSADLTALLVDFLNEALSLALTNLEAYDELVVVDLDLEATVLHAELAGHHASGFDDDVKAVTYHEADLARDDEGWHSLVVFDI